MSAPASYFDVIRNMPNAFDYRLRLAAYARQHGVEATARALSTTARAARKWLRRCPTRGLKGLEEHSRSTSSNLADPLISVSSHRSFWITISMTKRDTM